MKDPARLPLPAFLLLSFLLGLAACQSTAPVVEPETPGETIAVVADAPETPIGMARVTATSLNVRSGPSTSDAIVASVRRNQRVTLLSRNGAWARIRVASGEPGWVAARYLREEKGCSPDRDFEVVEAAPLTFSDSGAKGSVIVEATVGGDGVVDSTKIISNETGDGALAELAALEVSKMRFRAPVRNCVERKFIYTYRRTF
ncbi:MAG: SH3 domain-containing protein [Thermoanaerobaculia bacterium]